MSPLLITATAWVGLVAAVYWLLRTILKPHPNKRPWFVVGRLLSPATSILLAVSFLVTEDLALRIPLFFVAGVLGLLGNILQMHFTPR